MKNVYRKKREEGFTIIEVLIVLAIAAVILLIVFLAVPALQRNSRNNAIRTDAAAVLAGANDFIANNNGILPTGATFPDGTGTSRVSISGPAGTTATEAKVRGGTTVTFGTTMPTALGTIMVASNNKCNAAANAFQTTNRAIAAGFLVETTSGGGAGSTAPQCIES